MVVERDCRQPSVYILSVIDKEEPVI